MYSGVTLNQDKATKSQTVQIVRQGEETPYWFKVNLLSNIPLLLFAPLSKHNRQTLKNDLSLRKVV